MGSERRLIENTGSGREIVAALRAGRGDATEACKRGARRKDAP